MALKNMANQKWSGKHPIETLKDAGDLVKVFPNLTIPEWQSIFGELSNKKPANWQDLKEVIQNALDKKGKI
jgi:hypothetical protein